MKVSLNTKLPVNQINQMDGYGYATDRMLASLRNLGYEVSFNDRHADVGIVFDQPQHAKYYGNQYQILYHPWESTSLLPGWQSIMNSVDEVWTPSPLIAKWYEEYMGITRPIFVYQHGVDPIWSPVMRELDGTMRLLHVGGEAARKGWKETSQGFRFAFNQERFSSVQMTYKVIKKMNVPMLPGTKMVADRLSVSEMVQMYHDHHGYVYPSWGEGFGLTPLQAMATGMPVITSKVWAPYADYLDPNLTLGATLVASPWPVIHPGYMLRPDVDEIVTRLHWLRDNYEQAATFAYDNVERVTDFYSWDSLTKEVFEALEQRLGK